MKQIIKTTSPLLILTMIMLFTACKKNPPSKSTVELLQNKNWKITALTVSPGFSGAASDDLYNISMEACESDNIFRFNSSNVFVFDEGASKCDPLQSTNRKWHMGL